MKDLKSTTIHLKDGASGGTLDDIVVDLNTGRLAFYTLKSKGFLGEGIDRAALPPNVLRSQRGDVRIMADTDRLRAAPGTADGWPQQYDSQFVDTLYRHYGYSPDHP
ncbi:PRC-barrel domain-containing protein [Cesiribacter andamanensis]|uniref:PRC-barrel domain-containing protein n=1 Tax=Cesiribacter andamanensis TaxID=649507 RepID=UPI00034D3798|nr:PRC-barrel domain-containing protein [Cesiribacter andamanensis]